MYHDIYGRSWTGPYPFSPAAVEKHAPVALGVYQVLAGVEAGEVVAYIGIAAGRSTKWSSIKVRLRKHVTARANWALGQLGDPSKFSFVFYVCDPASARQIEAYVRTHAKPPFNVRPELQHLIPSIALH